MPKIVTPLTPAQVKCAKPKDKMYKLPDGGGLALWVLPSGKKSWRLTYTRKDGKQDTLTLGHYPDHSLADARDWRAEIKAKLAAGKNPKRLADDPGAAYRFENRLGDLLLSHHDKNKTDRAYNRAEFLDERHNALEKWGKDVMALLHKYRRDCFFHGFVFLKNHQKSLFYPC